MANTVVLKQETGRGYIAHAYDVDGANMQFLAIVRANPDNPNLTFVDVWQAPMGQPFPVQAVVRITPYWKIDAVQMAHSGADLIITMTTHEPKEAPRITMVEAFTLAGVWTPVAGVQTQQAGACVPPDNLPYFLPNNYVTRAQAAKMIAVADDLPIPTDGRQSFQDIAPGSTFYGWIEAMKEKGAIGGYPCVP